MPKKLMGVKRDGSGEETLKRALRFLAYCPRSEAEVRGKLAELGFSETVVETTLERLRSLKIVDDEKFARSWAHGRAGDRGYGPLRIERELRRRGISRLLVRQVVEEIFDEREGTERARALLEKRFAGKDLSEPKILRRAIAYLRWRGYRDAVIAEVLKIPLEE